MQAKHRSIFSLLVALTVLLFVTSVSAQSRLTSASSGNNVTIDGTSSVHDWTVKGQTINGNAQLPDELSADIPLAEVSWLASKTVNPSISVTIPVKSLKSGKGKMDDNMYEAFDAKKHPYVTFKLDKIWAVKAVSDDVVEAQAAGNLTMAGQSRPVVLKLEVTRRGNEQVSFEGRHDIDMRQYGIDPPTAMMGMMKTGPEVSIAFKWLLVQN